jgi:hypothetical protein
MANASSFPGRRGGGRRWYESAVAKPKRRGRPRQSPWRTTSSRVGLLALALIAAGVAAALIGGGSISGGGGDKPRQASGAPKGIADTIFAFRKALAAGDFETICNKLYTAQARAAAGGDQCPSVLQQTAGGVEDPQVKIVSITLRGDTATALVSASTAGDKPVQDTITLMRVGNGYRIVSAGEAPVSEP